MLSVNMYEESKSMNSTTEPSGHYYSAESLSFWLSWLFLLPSFSHMLLYQGPIYYEDEIELFIGIVFLPLKISKFSSET